MNASPKACESANKYLANTKLPADVREQVTTLVALVLAEAGNKIEALQDENRRLEGALTAEHPGTCELVKFWQNERDKEVGVGLEYHRRLAAIYDVAKAHHAEQPSHELLHSLTVVIPSICLGEDGN